MSSLHAAGTDRAGWEIGWGATRKKKEKGNAAVSLCVLLWKRLVEQMGRPASGTGKSTPESLEEGKSLSLTGAQRRPTTPTGEIRSRDKR